MHTCMNVHILKHTHMHVHTLMHTHTYTCTHTPCTYDAHTVDTHTYTHTHTHTHARTLMMRLSMVSHCEFSREEYHLLLSLERQSVRRLS